MKTHWILVLFMLSFSLGSCAPVEEPPAEPQTFPSEAATESPLQLGTTQEPTEMSSTPSVQKSVTLSTQDLAKRLGVEPGKIKLVKTEERLWLDTALGCPRPEQVYKLERVPGLQVWLEMDGVEYVYNTAANGQVVLCPELNPDVPSSIIGSTPNIGVPPP